MKPYPVVFRGRTKEFKELHEAMSSCETYHLPYPKRIYEQDIQPHARGWFGTKGDALTNRAEKEKERLQPQLSKAART